MRIRADVDLLQNDTGGSSRLCPGNDPVGGQLHRLPPLSPEGTTPSHPMESLVPHLRRAAAFVSRIQRLNPSALKFGRFAARVSGPGLGLARAVRPAGLAESPGSTARQRRVPLSGMQSTVEAGGASPDNARCSRPVPVTFRPALVHLARARRPGPARAARHRGVTAGTGCGRWRGCRARQQLASAGPASEGRERSCRPVTVRPSRPS
jgi:hypothetical protein